MAEVLIERREYKYLIDEQLGDRVRRAIAPYCQLDAHAAGEPDGRYDIDSLYLDSAAFDLFMANERTDVDRFKLRIRRYPRTPEAPVFLEVKRRINDVVSKSRGTVAHGQWQRLFDGPAGPMPPSVAPSHRYAVERFVTLATTWQAAPVTLVRYEREPWVSTIDDYVRITFDRKIRSLATRRFSFAVADAERDGWRSMDHQLHTKEHAAALVLELKFTTWLPLWLVDIVRRFDLQRLAFSKYGTSVLSWYGRSERRASSQFR